MAVVVAYLPMAVSLLQVLRICERNDIAVEWFKSTALEFYPLQIRLPLDRVTDNTAPPAPEVESVEVMAEWAAEYAAYLREMDLDAGIYHAMHQLFAVASTAGHGDDDGTRIAQLAATR